MNHTEPYTLKKTGQSKYLPLIIIISMFVFGLIPLSISIFADKGFPIAFIGFWYLILFINAFHFLKMPVEISVRDGQVSFKDIFGKEKSTTMGNIQEISITNGGLLIKTESFKVKGFGEFDGFSKFVENVRSINPLVKIKGC